MRKFVAALTSASADDAAGVNPNGASTFLASGVNRPLIYGKKKLSLMDQKCCQNIDLTE